MAQELPLEVAYARPEKQVVVTLTVAPGTTLGEAIDRSGLLARFPEIDLATHRIGVFGRLRELRERAEPGDRIEIYRPLSADPKDLRRRRAAQGRRKR